MGKGWEKDVQVGGKPAIPNDLEVQTAEKGNFEDNALKREKTLLESM